ncbi:MAG: hypothetical protein ACTSR1_06575 [Candidatus Heimdallarchaeota archaeon]
MQDYEEQEQQEKEESETLGILSARSKIHSEIEEKLISKLFTVVSNIEELPTGGLNFEPYTDHILIQLETFLDKQFEAKVFKKDDTHIAVFLEEIKKERERRDFGLLLRTIIVRSGFLYFLYKNRFVSTFT